MHVHVIRRGGRKTTRKSRDEEVLQEVAGLWDRDELLEAVSKDPVLSELISWVSRPSWEEIAGKSREVRYYW